MKKGSPKGGDAAQAALAKAAACLRDGRHGAALKALEKVLRKRKDAPDLLALAGTAALQAGDVRKAQRYLGKATRLAPEMPEAWLNLGVALEHEDRFRPAADAYRKALGLRPDYESAAGNLCKALHELARYEETAVHCRETLERFPGNREAHLNLALALRDLGQGEEAVATLEKGARACSEAGEILCNLGMLTFDEAAPDRAAEAFSAAHECLPDHPLVAFFLGLAREAQGRSGEARAAFDRVANSGPRNAYMLESWNYVRKARTPRTRITLATQDTLDLALEAANVEGLILEFGVRFGRSIRMIGANAGQAVHGFDSFEGLPEDWSERGVGSYTTEGVLPEVPDNVRLHVGLFEDTLPGFLEGEPGPLRLTNIDCDLYSSTVTIFDNLAERIVPGSVIVFDEYIMNPRWQEDEFKAFQEACAAHGWRYEYLAFSPFSRQAVAIIL